MQGKTVAKGPAGRPKKGWMDRDSKEKGHHCRSASWNEKSLQVETSNGLATPRLFTRENEHLTPEEFAEGVRIAERTAQLLSQLWRKGMRRCVVGPAGRETGIIIVPQSPSSTWARLRRLGRRRKVGRKGDLELLFVSQHKQQKTLTERCF